MYHDRKLLPGLGAPLHLEFKEDNSAALMEEIKKAVAGIGTDFEEFKKTNDARIKEVEKKGAADVVLETKLKAIGDNLDKLVEAKTAMEKRLDTEKKEREELELRLSRPGNSKEAAASALELKTFNDTMSAVAVERRRAFAAVDQKTFDDYGRQFKQWLRYGEAGPEFDRKTMSVGSDPDGGYWVLPDMSGQIAKKVFESGDIRQIASVQTITTDALEGIEDINEAGAGYAGELSQGSDSTTPQIGRWRIPVFWIDTEPKATQQLLDDSSVDVEAWLGAKVADKISRFENNEFITGAATKIRGITAGYTNSSDTGSGVTWGTMGYYPSGASADFASSNPVDNIINLTGILKNAYQGNARWLTRRSVITKMRTLKDGQGRYYWEPNVQNSQPERFLGYPITRSEDMPALAANSYSLAFGDFKQGYQIVDRMGIRVLRDPYTSKPYIKFYTTTRVGGAVINFEAIKLMKFATS